MRLLVNDGGVFKVGVEVLPGSESSLWHNNSKKVVAAASGGVTTGQHKVTEAVPVAADDLARKDYVNNQDAANLLAAQTYADGGDTVTLTNANSYTDSAVAPKADTTYVDSQDAATLASANSYTDGAVATTKKIVSGELSTLVAGQNAISFGITFASTPQVFITTIMAAGLGGAYNFGVNTRTTTGCNIYSSLATAGNLDGMMWIAIGPV